MPSSRARICPYCGVGCGQMVFHKDGSLISIEGDPGSPISRGHLCPKGADTFELHTHPKRLMSVKYRRPYGTEWEEIDAGNGDGHGRRSPVGEPRAAASSKSRTARRSCTRPSRRSPGRCHPRQRRELPDQETFLRRSGHGLHQQPSPDMTQLHGARSGHLIRTRRRDHCAD